MVDKNMKDSIQSDIAQTTQDLIKSCEKLNEEDQVIIYKLFHNIYNKGNLEGYINGISDMLQLAKTNSNYKELESIAHGDKRT